MIQIKMKRLAETATLPQKAHTSDACFDLYAHIPDAIYHEWNGGTEVKAANGIKIRPGETIMVGTGVAAELPAGYYAAIYARSGLASKQGLRPANCTGVIDCSYRGEWIVALHNDGAETRIVHNGDRVAQFAVLPVLDSAIEEVDELSETDRGTGGFGSTGK